MKVIIYKVNQQSEAIHIRIRFEVNHERPEANRSSPSFRSELTKIIGADY